MNILIACQAGPRIGLGHLTRSLVIGKALQRKIGATVSFLIQGESITRTDLEDFECLFLGEDKDVETALLKNDALDLVVLDFQPSRVSVGIAKTVRLLRARGVKVVGVDGLRSLKDELDLTFIPSFQLSVSDQLVSNSKVVFGWDCFLIADWGPPSEWLPGRNVLVLTGGSDATHLGAVWPNLLNQNLPSNVNIDWVTGPFSNPPKWPEKRRIGMLEHVAPGALGPLMRKANYAVTIFGVSFFELLQLGVPTVVYSPYGDKDSSELAEISQAGLALVAADEVDAIKKLNDLIQNEALAMELSYRGKERLSVSGSDRFCEEILKLIK